MKNLDKYTDQLIGLGISYGPRVLLSLVTLIVGWVAIGIISKVLTRQLSSDRVDPSLRSFLLSVSRITLKILLVISVAGMLGVEMTSFIAVLGAAGLAVGMALSGTLQNFAGGVMVLLFRPYQVGDFIEAQGYSGVVKEIQIFNTIVTTPDNKTVIIPNASLANGSLINYSSQPTRRVDLVFGIGYEDNIDKARQIICNVAMSDDRIHESPEPFVAVSELADSSVNLVTRVWTDSDNYWPVYFQLLEQVKKEFDLQGISIPYPQRDVHVVRDEAPLMKAGNA